MQPFHHGIFGAGCGSFAAATGRESPICPLVHNDDRARLLHFVVLGFDRNDVWCCLLDGFFALSHCLRRPGFPATVCLDCNGFTWRNFDGWRACNAIYVQWLTLGLSRRSTATGRSKSIGNVLLSARRQSRLPAHRNRAPRFPSSQPRGLVFAPVGGRSATSPLGVTARFVCRFIHSSCAFSHEPGRSSKKIQRTRPQAKPFSTVMLHESNRV